jgi:nicotinamide phosphoribosyltransferase
MLDFITLCDGYKLDHRRQYPPGTEYVLSNLTARSSRVAGVDEVVFLGSQYFLQRYLMEVAQQTFFDVPRDRALSKYRRLLDGYLGPNFIGIDHIAALHELGYVPLQFWSLPEGSRVPLRVPMMTWQNTLPEFFWVTNYIETLLSTCLWMPCTSATTARRYRMLLDRQARATGADPAFVDWQAHDFSFRGLSFPESAAMSGLGHLLSFTGTDSLPALQIAEEYYDHDGAAGGSVAATEHAVMCAGSKECELETFERILSLYPSGIVSVVSDTWDLWNVITNILPMLKDRIMGREGKIVIRPDSGDPADILCGSVEADRPHRNNPFPREKGVIELLWNIFGGTVNAAGFKELDPHIGAIYGDSITVERAKNICERLAAKGFASTNVVFGVGSYTYQYTTRDTYGFAVKATWAKVNGEERLLFKDPVTDDGTKRSARGRVAVIELDGELRMRDGLDLAGEAFAKDQNLLKPVWRDGRFLRRENLAGIRARLKG